VQSHAGSSVASYIGSNWPRDISPRTVAGDDVIRLSIGIEDKADIIADLEQGLAKVG
jgi:O-acetylhomoserine/O-acetylserine sulfhydrylase-like pyridoxal-dependent enzyme